MLQELLLALSGHESPIFDQSSNEQSLFTTPSEANLLESIGRLAKLHRALRTHALRIKTSHNAVICRAVASRLLSWHLVQFQDAILDVEKRILTRDASTVGAYSIVPLAGIVNSFDHWHRRMEWYWQISCFIWEPDSNDRGSQCTGPALINRLRNELHTGYTDIETAALDLVKTAEQAWLKQLSSWLLQGASSLPKVHDFFIEVESESIGQEPLFFVNSALLPFFVGNETAASVMFIGKMFTYLDNEPLMKPEMSHSNTNRLHPILAKANDIRVLSTLTSPIGFNVMSSTIASIRSSLSLRVVDGLLPVRKITHTLSSLREFFLAGRGDFIDTLIKEADKHVRSRHLRTNVSNNLSLTQGLAGAMMNEAEAEGILSKTWLSLISSVGSEHSLDTQLEWARAHLLLRFPEASVWRTPKKPRSSIATLEISDEQVDHFTDFLLPVSTNLTLRIGPPLDLFLTPQDIRAYSSIHNYLLSIRRSHIHVTELWTQKRFRNGPSQSFPTSKKNSAIRIHFFQQARNKLKLRSQAMRSTWAICKVVTIMLVELGNYMGNDVVSVSWHAFNDWAGNVREGSADESRPGTAQSNITTEIASNTRGLGGLDLGHGPQRAPLDPEMLAQGHRQFLNALKHALLLSDEQYVATLRMLLTHVEQLVAFVGRLQQIQNNLDLRDEGVLDNVTDDFEKEEEDVYDELRSAKSRVEADIDRLVEQLERIDTATTSSGPLFDTNTAMKTGFEPSRGSGIDKLLLRLDTQVGDEVDKQED